MTYRWRGITNAEIYAKIADRNVLIPVMLLAGRLQHPPQAIGSNRSPDFDDQQAHLQLSYCGSKSLRGLQNLYLAVRSRPAPPRTYTNSTTSPAQQVLGDRRLGEFDSEFEQPAVDLRRRSVRESRICRHPGSHAYSIAAAVYFPNRGSIFRWRSMERCRTQ